MKSSDIESVKKVPYTVGDDTKGGVLFLYGKPNASNVVICCAGFPDDHSIFLPFAQRLAKEGDCFVGVMCLPGYDDREEKPWTTHKKGGYTFDEMANTVRNAVKVLRAESTSEGAKLIGIFHDWGVVGGSMWANRSIEEGNQGLKPEKIAYFDVLPLMPLHQNEKPTPPSEITFYEHVLTLSYRTILAISFLLQTYVSRFLAYVFFQLGSGILFITKLGPLLDIDNPIIAKSMSTKGVQRIIHMAYPYKNFFQEMSKGDKAFSEVKLPKDLVKTPVLYMYGKEKRVHFHPDKHALKLLEREEKEGRSKCKVIALKDAGHWLYVQQEDICLEAVKSFIRDD